MSFDGIRIPRTLAVIHFIIGSLTNSQSISVAIVAVQGGRGHDNRVFCFVRTQNVPGLELR